MSSYFIFNDTISQYGIPAEHLERVEALVKLNAFMKGVKTRKEVAVLHMRDAILEKSMERIISRNLKEKSMENKILELENKILELEKENIDRKKTSLQTEDEIEACVKLNAFMKGVKTRKNVAVLHMRENILEKCRKHIIVKKLREATIKNNILELEKENIDLKKVITTRPQGFLDKKKSEIENLIHIRQIHHLRKTKLISD